MIRKMKEFLKVISLEKPNKLQLIKMLWRGLWVLPFFLIVNKLEAREYLRRYSVCLKCPIFDPELRRCRPFNGSSKGCGCYVPFSNIIYDKCWGRNFYGAPFGWGSSDKKSRLKRIRRKRAYNI